MQNLTKENHRITLLIMWMTALGQMANTIYLPAFPAISHDLQVDAALVKTTLSIFLLSYGISQFFYGLLSDLYGRKPMLLIGISIFSMGCFINSFANTLDLFLMARFLQGLGCGSVIVMGRSILLDRFRDRQLSSAASYLSMGFAVGFGVGPVIGAYLQYWLNWRTDFLFLLVAAVVMLICIVKFLPETAPRLAKHANLKEFFRHTIHEYRIIIVNINFLKALLGSVFIYGVVITYSVMSPFLIQTQLGYSIEIYGWLTVLIAVPYYVAARANRNLVLKFGSVPIVMVGVAMILSAGILLLVLGYFSLSREFKLVSFMVCFMLAAFGQAMIFPNAISAALKNFSHIPGHASAIFGSLQMLLIGVCAAILAWLPNTQNMVAIVLIAFGLLALSVLGRRNLY